MKKLILFIPQYSPINPFGGISLSEEDNEEEIIFYDLNIEFYNKILTKKYLERCYSYIIEEHIALKKFISQKCPPSYDIKNAPFDFILKYKKFLALDLFVNKKLEETQKVISQIEFSVSVLKNKEYFYRPSILFGALDTIDRALYTASLPFSPAELSLYSYNSPYLNENTQILKFHAQSDSLNPFSLFLKTKVNEIINEEADEIEIVTNSFSNVVSGLSLANILQEKSANIKFKGSHSKYIKSLGLATLENEEVKNNSDYYKKLNLEKYFIEKPVLALEYDKNLVNNIQELQKTTNTDCFEIKGEALMPDQLWLLANEINKRDLKVFFSIKAQFKNEFTPEILDFAHNCGLRMIFWNFKNETSDVTNRMAILNNADIAGIWNFVEFNYSEKNIEIIKNNKDVIHSFTFSSMPDKKIFLELCKNTYKDPLWLHLRHTQYLFLYIVKYGSSKVINTKLRKDDEENNNFIRKTV